MQGPLLCIDEVNPETGKSLYGSKTLEQIQAEYPGAEIADLDTWAAAKEKALCTIPEPITEDRFMEMLEVLPPQRWQIGRRMPAWDYTDSESFELSEHTSGRVTLVCVRVGDDYFSYQTIAGQRLSAHVHAVLEAKKAQETGIKMKPLSETESQIASRLAFNPLPAFNPLMETFNILVHRADVLTRYMLDQSGPEELWDSLIADGWPGTARELRRVSEQLGYFKNGKLN